MTERQRSQYDTIRKRSDDKIIGMVFHRLTVINFSRYGKHFNKYYLCKCKCGTEKEISSKHLRSGRTRSCGCLWEEEKHSYRKIHGESGKKLYSVWCSIKGRCLNKKDQAYHNYGGRGIDIAEEWLTYANFRAWALRNGYSANLQIDRIDNNIGYYPDNCHFVTSKENNRNKRTNIWITFSGETLCIADWSLRTGIKAHTIAYRNRMGWAIEKIFQKPRSICGTMATP